MKRKANCAERDQGSRAGGDAVDGGDDRDRTLAYPLDHRPGHSCELEQPLRIHLEELADDLVDVATGTEAAPTAGDDEDPHVVSMRQLSEQVAEVGIDVERECVQPLRTVEGHSGDAVGNVEHEVPPLGGEAR